MLDAHVGQHLLDRLDLADCRAGLSVVTAVEFEAGRRHPYERTLDAIRAALEAAGVEFTDGDRPGVRLK